MPARILFPPEKENLTASRTRLAPQGASLYLDRKRSPSIYQKVQGRKLAAINLGIAN
jgi:hypothetical protein